jgi:hypothetical protein
MDCQLIIYFFLIGAIENTIGEHIGNLMRIHWEFEDKMLGTNEKWKIK